MISNNRTALKISAKYYTSTDSRAHDSTNISPIRKMADSVVLHADKPKNEANSKSNCNRNFSNPEVRAEHYKPANGRLPVSIIIRSICGMVAFVAPHCSPNDTFFSNDLCIDIWEDYPDQHQYFGYHISALEREGKLPIVRVGTDGKRAIYALSI